MFGDPSRQSLLEMHPVFAWTAVAFALLAAAILIWFLWRRPPFDGTTKILLLFGFGVFPIAAATSVNVVGVGHTRMRGFCGSCHVMEPFTDDAASLESASLAAVHARNNAFGLDNCYQCHSDYGMFGQVITKIGGLNHVYEYYTEYHDKTIDEALDEIRLYQPFPNTNCIQCHSTRTPKWLEVREHRSLVEDVRSGEVSCMGSGCHGPAHPFAGEARAEAQRAARSEGGAP